MSFFKRAFLPLISKYLCREFLHFFFFSLTLLVGLFILVDFFDRLDEFIKYAASASAILRYLLFKAPLFLTQAVPIAAVTGALLSFGLLSRHRELLALKACGVSSWQMAAPLLLTASLLSIGVWTWNEFIVPAAFRTSRHINTVEIKKKSFKGIFHERGFWYHGRRVFYHIDHFDSRKKILSGLTAYILGKNFQVQHIVKVGRARWRNGQWQIDNAHEQPLAREKLPAAQPLETWLQETPEDFALIDMKAEELSSGQLRAYITDLQRKGLDTTEYQVDLQLKGAFPFATFAMALLGVALAIPGARQFALPTALGFVLIAGFGYWILLALTISLGQNGTLSPVLAAWLANGVICLLGMFFLLGID